MSEVQYCSNVACSNPNCTKHKHGCDILKPGEKKPVLLAIDESVFSQYATRWAMHMFRDAEFMLVHAYDFVPSGLGSGEDLSGEYVESLHEQAEANACRVLRKVENLFDEMGRSLSKAVVVRGEPRSVITNLIKEYNLEVVVVGSRGASGVVRLLGSVSDHLLHNAPCNVCIVHPPPELPLTREQSWLESLVELRTEGTDSKEELTVAVKFPMVRTIFVALDGSDHALKAFQWAKTNIIRKGDEVVFIMSYTPLRESLITSIFGPPSFSLGEEDKSDDNVRVRLTEYANNLAKETRAITGQNARLCLKAGDARDVIRGVTEHAGEMSVLVMGSRGRGLVKRALLGSVVDHVAKHATCPILIVK